MPSSALAIIFALLAAILMGTIGVFARFAALPAEHVTFYRLMLGALFLLAYMLLTGKGHQICHRPSKRNLVNGAMLAGFMAFYIEAIQYTQMANVIMIIYLAPVVSAIFAHYFFAEKLTRLSMASVVVALMGFMLMLPTGPQQASNHTELLGYFYALLALLTYSGFMLINRKPSLSSPYQSTLVQLCVGALCLLPLVINAPLTPSLPQIAWLVAIGFFPGFLAILLAVKALRQLPAVTFGTIAYVEPVIVVTLAWWIFGETLSPMQLSGVSLIILAGISQGFISQRKMRVASE